jgi:hypothetical protein
MLWFFFGTGMTTAAYQNARHKMLKQGMRPRTRTRSAARAGAAQRW